MRMMLPQYYPTEMLTHLLILPRLHFSYFRTGVSTMAWPVNWEKSFFMFFLNPKMKLRPPNITSININDITIQRTSEFKYLGVVLDENHTFKKHANHVIKKPTPSRSLKPRYWNERHLQKCKETFCIHSQEFKFKFAYNIVVICHFCQL